jgi:hypothetical protein
VGGIYALSSKNERAKLEMKIMTYRALACSGSDPETLKFIADRIAKLEQKLKGTKYEITVTMHSIDLAADHWWSADLPPQVTT